MRQQIRFFAIGLLTASLLIFAFYLINDDTNAQVENVPTEDLIAQIESDGYRVISEEEFIDYSFYREEQSNDEETDEDVDEDNVETDENNEANDEDGDADNDEEAEEEEDEVTTISLTVSQGDVSQDIAAELVDNDIIEDAAEFVQYLEDNDYSPYIQLGTFEVTSDMSLEDIAETITTFPGN